MQLIFSDHVNSKHVLEVAVFRIFPRWVKFLLFQVMHWATLYFSYCFRSLTEIFHFELSIGDRIRLMWMLMVGKSRKVSALLPLATHSSTHIETVRDRALTVGGKRGRPKIECAGDMTPVAK